MKTLITTLETLILSLFVTTTTYAQNNADNAGNQSNGGKAVNAALDSLNATGNAAGFAINDSLPVRVGGLINGVISIIGIIFLIVTVYGGFRILLSGGDSNKIKNGREAILYGVIGMIIIMTSYALTKFAFKVFGTAQ